MDIKNPSQVLNNSKKTTVSILLFGIARDIIGGKVLELEIEIPSKAEDVQKQILTKFPAFEDLRSLKLAVDTEYAAKDTLIRGHEELALIPPVSGG